MSEYFNITPELTVVGELVQSGESLEPLSCNDKSDYDNVDDLNPKNCTDILDVGGSIDNCDETNRLISIEKSTNDNKEMDLENAEMPSDGDKLIDVDSENVIDQMGMYMTSGNDPSISVFDQANIIVNAKTDAVEVALVDETAEINNKEMTGKLKSIIFNC